jgi:F-type H+-transporting ATPase subunit g
LFGVELYAWFCVGEIAGRGFTITGYKVWIRSPG